MAAGTYFMQSTSLCFGWCCWHQTKELTCCNVFL